MQIVDAHCHPLLLEEPKRQSLLASWTSGILLSNGLYPMDFEQNLQLHRQHTRLIPAIGWHPWRISPNLSEREIENLFHFTKEMCSKYRCPIGEIGLDFHPNHAGSQIQQQRIFEGMCQIAMEFNLPISVHAVRCHHIVLQQLKRMPTLCILLHDYRGNPQITLQYLRYDCYFGYALRKPNMNWQTFIEHIPIERVLVESDTFTSHTKFQIYVEQQISSEKDVTQVRFNLFKFLQEISDEFKVHFENLG